MVQEVDDEPSQWLWGWREREQVRVARRSLMGPVDDGLWGVRRRRSLASGRVAGPSLGWGCRRRTTGEEGAPGTSRVHGSWLFSASLLFGEGVTRLLGAGEPQTSHGRRELHRTEEPGAAGGGERDAGRARARAQRRRLCGGGGARIVGGRDRKSVV